MEFWFQKSGRKALLLVRSGRSSHGAKLHSLWPQEDNMWTCAARWPRIDRSNWDAFVGGTFHATRTPFWMRDGARVFSSLDYICSFGCWFTYRVCHIPCENNQNLLCGWETKVFISIMQTLRTFLYNLSRQGVARNCLCEANCGWQKGFGQTWDGRRFQMPSVATIFQRLFAVASKALEFGPGFNWTRPSQCADHGSWTGSDRWSTEHHAFFGSNFEANVSWGAVDQCGWRWYQRRGAEGTSQEVSFHRRVSETHGVHFWWS